MIQLEELVFAFNEYIGRDKFDLHLNTNGVPQADDRIVGTLNVGRIPYGFSSDEIDAENLTLTFTFDMPCGDVKSNDIRDNAAITLSEKLLGWKTIYVTFPNGLQYRINSFLELQPVGAPYVDCGVIKQQFVYSGTALAQNLHLGAIVGNEENVFIDGSQVLKLGKTSSTQITGDNVIPLSEDKYTPELENIATATVLNISCLYTGSSIDEELYGIGEGVISNPNKVYEIKTVRENEGLQRRFTITRQGKLTSVSTRSEAGVFLQYEATFQIIGDPIITDEEL